MPQCFNHILKASLLLCLSCLFTQAALAEQSSINADIQQLESDFRDLSAAFYQATSNIADEHTQPIIDIDQLLIAVMKLHDSSRPIEAIQLIQINKETIIDNSGSVEIFKIIELLLESNEWNLASTLFEEVENANEQSIVATVQFLFAKYHAQRHKWQQVNILLEDKFEELSEENTGYAYLLNGAALQHLKKHRQAIKNYEKVTKSSLYYSYAQLSSATAHIRQGWWTDAQTKIHQLLKHSNKINKDEVTNRIYLVLGYALLQRDFFRDARNAFREIGLNSRYTNRALLGIGLTATSQGDYIGGLNALTILKEKKTLDLSVDESYLLVPYIYEKLQQELTATSAYSEAIKYYKQRMDGLDILATQNITLDHLEYRSYSNSLIIQKNNFDYGSRYPESFIKNFQRLQLLNESNNNPEIKNQMTQLLTRFGTTLQDIAADLINERKTHLKSYLDQSRYGLARLYDNSKKEEE